MPDEILDAPQLQFELGIYWEAYCNLTTCRPPAMGALMPIPWDTIQRYAETCLFDREQTSNLHYFARKMDEALMRRENVNK